MFKIKLNNEDTKHNKLSFIIFMSQSINQDEKFKLMKTTLEWMTLSFYGKQNKNDCIAKVRMSIRLMFKPETEIR